MVGKREKMSYITNNKWGNYGKVKMKKRILRMKMNLKSTKVKT